VTEAQDFKRTIERYTADVVFYAIDLCHNFSPLPSFRQSTLHRS
jgi:hypothetical protein